MQRGLTFITKTRKVNNMTQIPCTTSDVTII
jgi:hypothetical protein